MKIINKHRPVYNFQSHKTNVMLIALHTTECRPGLFISKWTEARTWPKELNNGNKIWMKIIKWRVTSGD